jgi:uncharacterized membrane protein YbhN (UPF0104 family)
MARSRLAASLRRLLRGALLTLLMLAVLGGLLWYGNAGKVVAAIGRFQPIYLLWFAVFLIVQELARAALWSYLLEALCAHIPLRSQMFAFAAGEAVKFLPTGAYLQNYLLQRSQGTDFGRSSAATTAMISGEIAAALLGFVILGAGAWSLWFRVAIVVSVLFAIWLLRRYLTSLHETHTPRWAARRRVLRFVFDELRRFRAGAAALIQPRIVRVTLLLSLIQVLSSGAGLYVVVRGLGIDGVSFWQAVGVNCFGLAFYVVLGSLEAADVGAFIGIGVTKSAAVSAILVNRGLSIGMTAALAAIVMVLLRDEWRAIRPGTRARSTAGHARPQQQEERVASAPPPSGCGEQA